MALIPRKRMSSDLLDPEPREGSFNGVTSDGVFKGTGKAIDKILDDGSASETIVVAVPVSQSSNYTVGNYYEVQGKVARLRTKTDGDDVTQLTFDTTSGILDAINDVSTVALFRFSGTDYPLNADMNDEFLKGKTVVLMHNPGGTQYDFYYLVQRASGSGHVTMYFKGRYNSVKVADDTWTFYNDSVNAVAIAPLYDSTSTYPTVGTAVMYNGKRYVNNVAINTSEDWSPDHWTEKSVEDEIGSIKNGDVLTDAASVNVPNDALSTLATAQAALTLNVNVGANEVPNFAVEVTPSVDVTLTVTKTVNSTATELSPSVSGGNSLTSGKKYQVTCVGSCWTLAEFTVPTP